MSATIRSGRLRRLVTFALGLTLVGAVPSTSGARAETSFTAAASATGVFLQTNIPGVPIQADLVGAGGPTAQVRRESFGANEGYAAFPDPGTAFVTLPGTIAGLLASGVGGLPPIDLPALPDYPLYVRADLLNPNASLGDGPYRIEAAVTDEATTAAATGGAQISALGNMALVRTESSVVTDGGGKVTARAATIVQGLTIGPLTLGEIRAVASQTLDGSTVTQASSLEITAARIGGLPVSITGEGLNVAGVAIPVPIASTLANLLKGAGLELQMLTAQSYPNRVVAPAIQITGPVTVPELSTAPGSYTITIGQVSAYLETGTSPTPSPAKPPANPGSVGSVAPSSPIATSGGTGPGTSGATSTGTAAPPTGTAAPTAGTGPSVASGPLDPTLANAVGLFDLTSTFLLLVLFGGAAMASGHLIRRLGVRGPWTS